MKGDHPNPQESLGVWQKMNSVLSIAPLNEGTEDAVDESSFVSDDAGGMTIEEADAKCELMDAAKKEKNYEASDAIRKEILDAGYEVQQTPEGSKIKRNL
jgi:cysteinyl-tRNA synthetase